MSQYNLSDNVNDSFEFQIATHVYRMRYPIVSEVEDMQTLIGNTDKKGEVEQTQKLQDFMYSLITPVDPKSPSIEEVLKSQNFKVLKNFNTMVSTELGIE